MTRPVLLYPAEVAATFRCDVRTAGRWDAAGKLPAVRTPTGQRRWHVAVVWAALVEGGCTAEEADARIATAVQENRTRR